MLRDLAAREQSSMQSILEKAIEDYRDKLFFEAVNRGYAALKASPEAWKQELEERRAWDTTLGDGLEEA